MSTHETPTVKDYAILLVKQLQQLGDTRKWGFDAAGNRLVTAQAVDGSSAGRAVINLYNSYSEWVKLPPVARPERVQRTALATMADYVPSNWSVVRPHILPIVRSSADRGQLIVMSPPDAPQLIHRPICDGLEMGLGCDNPHNIVRLNDGHLAQWGISEDEAISVALENLRARSSQPMKELQHGLYVSTWDDFYDASRMLLPEVMQRHISMGAPVVMAPTKYGLFLCSDRSDFALALMTQLAEKALDEPRAMCPLMLRWADNRWNSIAPKAQAVKLNHLKTLSLGGEYHTQKQIMEERLKEQGRDIFVATFMVGRAAATEPMSSACSWSKGVPSLLPRTELICFVDPHGRQEDAVVVSTADAIAIVGNLMRPTADLPPRFFVDAFPSDAQLAQLRRAANSGKK